MCWFVASDEAARAWVFEYSQVHLQETLKSILPEWFHSSNLVLQHHNNAYQKNNSESLLLFICNLMNQQGRREEGCKQQGASTLSVFFWGVKNLGTCQATKEGSGRPWGGNLEFSRSAGRKFLHLVTDRREFSPGRPEILNLGVRNHPIRCWEVLPCSREAHDNSAAALLTGLAIFSQYGKRTTAEFSHRIAPLRGCKVVQ